MARLLGPDDTEVSLRLIASGLLKKQIAKGEKGQVYNMFDLLKTQAK